MYFGYADNADGSLLSVDPGNRIRYRTETEYADTSRMC
jgi:hypothetical protein